MIKRLAAAALAASAFAGLAWAQTALGPSFTAFTASAQGVFGALPANPTRRAVTICNGHASQSITFTMGSLSVVSLTQGIVIPGGNLATSCFTVGSPSAPAQNVGAQVNVVASGAATPVTFIEYQ